MSTTTKKLNLIKPELTDSADITNTNENWDKIDKEFQRVSFGLSTNIKDYALTLEQGFYAVHLTGASYTGTDLPTGNYMYGSAIIYVRIKEKVITIMLLGTKTSPPQFASCENGTWSEWSTQLLPLTGGELTGELIVNENFQVRKSFDDVPYRSYLRPINYSIGGNGDYSTGIIHYNDGVNHAQLIFNKDGVMLRDNVNEKVYHIYGQYNKDLLNNFFLSLDGGVLKGNLDFKKVENGSATIYKNHSATADYGLIIRDVDADGDYNQLILCAQDNTLQYRDTKGKTNAIFGQHNRPDGTYTGTAKARNIQIGGNGKMVLVVCDEDIAVFTTSYAIKVRGINGSSGVYQDSNNYYSNAILHLDATFMNSLDKTYTYKVL